MGTRSVIKFQENNETICAIYQQFDGYPEGVGRELFFFLDDMTIVNGLSVDQPKRVANGIGCLAAQFVAQFKDGAGGFYMTPPDDTQEYDYIVNASWEGEGWKAKLGEPTVTVFENGNEIFSGSVMDFGLFIDSINDVEDEVA
jgi:hypothetical protein